MIDMNKVYYMTEAAIFEQKEKNESLKIIQYRRKDYILSHIILVFLSVTAAYTILVGLVLFLIIMAHDEIVLNVSQMVVILVGIVLLYLVILAFYYVVSHKYYGDKHVRARQKVKNYLDILRELEALDKQGSAPAARAAEQGDRV